MVTSNCHHFFIRILPENTTMNLEGKLAIQKKHILRYAFYIIFKLEIKTSFIL